MKLMPFVYNNHQVRIVERDGSSWWVAKDVCSVLGIEKYRDAISKLDDDERGSLKVDTLGGEQEMASINESGLYTLILRSNKPEAKPFRKWVTSQVLPALRKTGHYSMPGPGNRTQNEALGDTAFVRSKVALLFSSHVRMAKVAGLSGLDAVSVANRLTEEVSGYNVLETLDISETVTSKSELVSTPMFCKECLQANPDGAVSTTEVFDLYQDWCNSTGRRQVGRHSFHSQLLDYFPSVRKTRYTESRRAHFVGVELRPEAATMQEGGPK